MFFINCSARHSLNSRLSSLNDCMTGRRDALVPLISTGMLNDANIVASSLVPTPLLLLNRVLPSCSCSQSSSLESMPLAIFHLLTTTRRTRRITTTRRSYKRKSKNENNKNHKNDHKKHQQTFFTAPTATSSTATTPTGTSTATTIDKRNRSHFQTQGLFSLHCKAACPDPISDSRALFAFTARLCARF